MLSDVPGSQSRRPAEQTEPSPERESMLNSPSPAGGGRALRAPILVHGVSLEVPPSRSTADTISLISSRSDLSQRPRGWRVCSASPREINQKDQHDWWRRLCTDIAFMIYMQRRTLESKMSSWLHQLPSLLNINNAEPLSIFLQEMALLWKHHRHVWGEANRDQCSAGNSCGLALWVEFSFFPVPKCSYWFVLCTDSHCTLPALERHAMEHLCS